MRPKRWIEKLQPRISHLIVVSRFLLLKRKESKVTCVRKREPGFVGRAGRFVSPHAGSLSELGQLLAFLSLCFLVSETGATIRTHSYDERVTVLGAAVTNAHEMATNNGNVFCVLSGRQESEVTVETGLAPPGDSEGESVGRLSPSLCWLSSALGLETHHSRVCFCLLVAFLPVYASDPPPSFSYKDTYHWIWGTP